MSLGRNKNKQFKDELSDVCSTKIKYEGGLLKTHVKNGCEFSDMLLPECRV